MTTLWLLRLIKIGQRVDGNDVYFISFDDQIAMRVIANLLNLILTLSKIYSLYMFDHLVIKGLSR